MSWATLRCVRGHPEQPTCCALQRGRPGEFAWPLPRTAPPESLSWLGLLFSCRSSSDRRSHTHHIDVVAFMFDCDRNAKEPSDHVCIRYRVSCRLKRPECSAAGHRHRYQELVGQVDPHRYASCQV